MSAASTRAASLNYDTIEPKVYGLVPEAFEHDSDVREPLQGQKPDDLQTVQARPWFTQPSPSRPLISLWSAVQR